MRRRTTKGNDNSKLVELREKKDKLDLEVKRIQFEINSLLYDKSKGRVFNQNITDKWSIYHGDCVEVVSGLPDDSIHYSIFSPPFLSLYVYSDDYRDMGNSISDDQFYTHFEYLIPQLFRVTKPGRLVTVHCSLVNMSLSKDGVMGVKDLPGRVVYLFEKYGFIYHSKVNVWKDPLVQAVRTKHLGLAHKQVVKDSSKCVQGFADELLTFRKPGENVEKIGRGRGFEYYIGTQKISKNTKKSDDPRLNKYSHFVWQRYASPVWFDIDQTNTLNYRMARDKNDERHIVPLQLDVISRCLELWTNQGDTVLSPFAGIGSEGYVSIQMGRKFIGVELKLSYYLNAIKNIKLGSRKLRKFFDKSDF